MAVQLKDICLVLIPEAPLMTLSGLAVGNNTTSSSAAAAVNSALALGSNNSSSINMNGSTANDHDQCLISTVISSSVELWPWSPLAVAT
ncbi:unnamed protein product, partial [Anisakis simplex]|uniref:Secreted protein n=1 Tax=Anisakis simplex TaxID=6269 RepID=A0A0M3JHH3_ANISI